MLNLSHVSAFLAVIDGGSFHEAARRLGLGQPTVSQHVKLLEAELGQTLIDRRRGGCVPTRHGGIFEPYARSLIATAVSARTRLAGERIALGASSNIGIYLMPRDIRRISDADPAGGEIELTIASNPEVAERLSAGALDLAAMEWWDDRPGFTALDWRRETLVLIVPPEHRWAGRERVSVADLAGVPLLGGERGSGTGTLLRRRLGRAARQLTMGRNLGSTEAVKRAVMAGLGVSLVSASAVADEVAHGSLVALHIDGADLTKDLKIVLPSTVPDHAPAFAVARRLLSLSAAASTTAA